MHERRPHLPPVPPEFSGTILAPDIDPTEARRPGMPRPQYRQVPIPYTARVEPGELNVIESEPAMWLEVLQRGDCVLCGCPLRDEQRLWFFAGASTDMSEGLCARGALHHRCAILTAYWCVHIRNHLLNGDIRFYSAPIAALDQAVQLITFRDDIRLAGGTLAGEYRIRADVSRLEQPFKGMTLDYTDPR